MLIFHFEAFREFQLRFQFHNHLMRLNAQECSRLQRYKISCFQQSKKHISHVQL